MERAARSYCVLEVDRESGERNQRDDRLSILLRRLTGAEAAIAVNNNAAAVYLLLKHHLERGRARRSARQPRRAGRDRRLRSACPT
jgi:seryl-tRNA(Sec) selenium transferase